MCSGTRFAREYGQNCMTPASFAHVCGVAVCVCGTQWSRWRGARAQWPVLCLVRQVPPPVHVIVQHPSRKNTSLQSEALEREEGWVDCYSHMLESVGRSPRARTLAKCGTAVK